MIETKPATPKDAKFWITSGLIVLSAAVFTASFVPVAQSAAKAESVRLAQAGQGSSGYQSLLNYKLAYLLDRTNSAAALQLAKYNLSIGQSDLAIKQLEAVGESPEALRLRLRTELELNRPEAVTQTAHRLVRSAHTNEDLTLAATAFAATQHPDKLDSLKSRLSSPEAVQRVQRLQSSTTAIGLELYALGLLDSSERILQAQPASVPRNITLASILSRKKTSAALEQARDLYLGALRLDPSNLEARQALVAVYTSLKDKSGADEQAALVTKLESQRP